MATDNTAHGPPQQLQQPPTSQATDIIDTTSNNAAVEGDSRHRRHVVGKISEIDTTTETAASRTPAHKLPIDVSSTSPLSRLASPSDSDFSFSPPSAGFLSLLGAATATPLTPLSSLDGGDAWCPPSLPSVGSVDDCDNDQTDHNDQNDIGDDNGSHQDTMFPFGDMPKSAG